MLLRVWWVLLLLKTLHLSGSEKQQGGCSAIGGHARARHFGGLSAKGWTETSFRMFQKHASDASETSFLGAFDNFSRITMLSVEAQKLHISKLSAPVNMSYCLPVLLISLTLQYRKCGLACSPVL